MNKEWGSAARCYAIDSLGSQEANGYDRRSALGMAGVTVQQVDDRRQGHAAGARMAPLNREGSKWQSRTRHHGEERKKWSDSWRKF